MFCHLFVTSLCVHRSHNNDNNAIMLLFQHNLTSNVSKIRPSFVSRWWKLTLRTLLVWWLTEVKLEIISLWCCCWGWLDFFFLSLVFAPLKKVLIWERRTGSLLENQLFTEPSAREIRQKTLRRAYEYICIRILFLPAPTRCPL